MDVSRETLLQLLELQKIDSEIDRLEAKRRNLPEQAELDRLNEDLATIEREIGDQQSVLDKVSSRQKKLDVDVERVTLKLNEEEAKLNSGDVTSSRELQSLQMEIDSLRRRKANFEEDDLDAMEEREGAEKILNEFKDNRTELLATIEAATVARDAAAGTIQTDLLEAQSRRDAEAPKFSSELAEYYEDLRASKAGVAIAALVDGACQGCHMRLPAQEYEKVMRSQGIAYCEECRRILVPV